MKAKTTGKLKTQEEMIAYAGLIIHPRCGKPKKPKEGSVNVSIIYCTCGRPSEYNDALLEKAYEYLDMKMPNIETDEVIHTIEGLCDYINIHKDTAYQWSKEVDKKEFSDVFNSVMRKQGRKLLNGGVRGVFNSTITKLMLTKHGYRDAVDNITREIPIDPEAKRLADEALDAYIDGEK